MLSFLERRLDNVVHRMGFGTSRSQARQLVNHRHVQVNGRTVDIPSFEVRAGDVVQLREKARKNEQVQASVASAQARGIPEWLQIDPENYSGSVISLPVRENITLPIQEQLIVELYSK